MAGAKALHMAPRAIAQAIVDHLELEGSYFGKVGAICSIQSSSAVPPGKETPSWARKPWASSLMSPPW